MDSNLRILSRVKDEQVNRRTKILCTIGPACYKREVMRDMMLNGMDGARLNFSHGSRRGFEKMIAALRGVATSIGHNHFSILQDLQGPKIRVGKLQNNQMYVEHGDTFQISSENNFVGTSQIIPCTYPNFAKDVRVGSDVFVDDGKIQLHVVRKIDEKTVEVKTVVGGMIYTNKGLNMPNSPISSPILMEKDLADLKFGLEQKVDYVCLSFVSRADDIMKCHKLMIDPKFNPSGYVCPIIAKIERQEAIVNLTEIVKMAGKLGGGLMVARGDLAVEAGYAKLPILQKRITSECMKYGVTCITATEMLMSMCKNPLPTRAEVCDVANAILDHSSVLMLSNETAMGKYPVKTVKMAADVCREVDQEIDSFGRPKIKVGDFEYYESNYEIILVGGKIMARKHRCTKCVVIFTHTGFTAEKFAAQRLGKPVFAFTDSESTFRRLSLVWGVIPVRVNTLKFDEDVVKNFIVSVLFKSIDIDRDAFVFVSGGGVDPKYCVRLISFCGDTPEKVEEVEGEKVV